MTSHKFYSRCAAFIYPAIHGAWAASRPTLARLARWPMLAMLPVLIICAQPCDAGAASATKPSTPAAPASGSYSQSTSGYSTNGFPEQTLQQASDWRQDESTRADGGLYQEGVYLGELLNRAPVLQIAYCAETRGELLPCGT